MGVTVSSGHPSNGTTKWPLGLQPGSHAFFGGVAFPCPGRTEAGGIGVLAGRKRFSLGVFSPPSYLCILLLNSLLECIAF